MRPALVLLITAGCLGLLPSCSLLALDQFRVVACGECGTLNARDGIAPGACRVWQCDGARQFCEFGDRDEDGDGNTALECGGTDCDDEDPMSGQGGMEICDGGDNDCDGVVDEVSMEPPAPVTVLSEAALPTFVAYGAAPDGVVVTWRSGSSTRIAVVSQILSPTTSVALTGETNAMPESALTSSAASAGCPDAAISTLAPTPCGALDACPGAQVCVTAPDTSRVCEQPVLNNSPLMPMECLTHAECQDGITCNGRETCEPRSDPSLVDARGCRAAASDTPCGAAVSCDEALDACIVTSIGPCAFADMALSPISSSEWIATSVTTDGCAAGRVRTGIVDATDPTPSMILWGDGRLSTTWLGVDLDESGCTGRSRAASEAGAAGLSIATLPFDPVHGRPVAQALAAWRAAPVCSGHEACDGPPTAAIEVLGLWRELGDAGGAPIRWVSGSDDGEPVQLVDSAVSPGVSVTSWALPEAGAFAAGYALAYARTGGGVALAFVHAATTPPLAPSCLAEPVPPVCLAPEAGPDLIIGSADDSESRTRIAMPGAPRTTPALGLPVSEVLDPTAAPVGDVSITIGSVADAASEVPVALAWATATEIVVARATFDPETDMLTDGDRLRFPAAGAADVTIVHVDGGLIARDVTMPTELLGGLVVTWSTSAGTFAARIADRDGALVGPGAVRLGGSTEDPHAFVDTLAGVSTLRVVAHQGDSFVAFPTVCGTAP